MNKETLSALLAKSSRLHRHLCPRQVLGVRMGLAAGDLLGLELPQKDRRLYTIAETDGCATDGISVATNCWVGRRTLRVEDFGKVAATFVDSHSGLAVRLVPRAGCRQGAWRYAPQAPDLWQAMLVGYQSMPVAELFTIQEVRLKAPLERLISQPDKKATCHICGEEVINEREIVQNGLNLCRACAGMAYYDLLAPAVVPAAEFRARG
jgi:formylmethanofuran dehydrogenase subunit E